ncbi:polysaccharide deacetylase family protein [Actinomadura oligospora]|uniref:polysaccharide deacetylase family protein n=1 Tax=Actinomadura oligospora TaxID=111804 RepID=UPI00047D575B|nr:polysaccharide deacetylase family protein [Actinomadura oligospora]
MADTGTSGPTRRTALTLLGVAGLAVLGADDALHGQAHAARAQQSANAGHPAQQLKPTPTPKPKPVPTPRPASWSQQRLTLVKAPIRDLFKDVSPPAPPNSIALTIDDGPHPTWTPQVLDVLAEFKVHATFFQIGEQIVEFPKLTRRVVEAGHQICNHTQTHPIPFDHVHGKRLRKEVIEPFHRVADVTGVVPTLFRAPGGAWSKASLELIAEHGMLPVDWAVDPTDWSRPGVGHIRRTMLSAKAGNVLLCHDGGGDRSQTVAALRAVIPKLKKRGLNFVTL